MAALKPVSEVKIKESVEVRFRWDKDNKISNLIQSLSNFKSQMEYNNKDFNADKSNQYESCRKALANIYCHEPSWFGPVCPYDNILSEQNKIDITLIKRGYTRVQEKIKEIRQNFSLAVTSGRRSGSGKIVLEFYDHLVQIWGGSPSIEPLFFGKSTYDVNKEIMDNNKSVENLTCSTEDTTVENTDNVNLCSSSCSIEDNSVVDFSLLLQSPETSSVDSDISTKKKKRKNDNNEIVPKFIDNKRRHMQRQLSASQRDQILLNEAKEDAQFKRDIAEAIRHSNETFSASIERMSESILQVAQGLSRSMELLFQGMKTNQQ
ncbi:uncharacterized protein LOC136072834 [Hydra vulgaris]|uniref:uncharacterized protein LOC136072834 n=1 Tax=Hydra vulgaris TaxID=6087 RepID=UPI0032EA5E92